MTSIVNTEPIEWKMFPKPGLLTCFVCGYLDADYFVTIRNGSGHVKVPTCSRCLQMGAASIMAVLNPEMTEVG